jgi:hypothetical protein
VEGRALLLVTTLSTSCTRRRISERSKIEADPRIEAQMQRAELDYLASSRAAQTVLAENYVGLPF